VIREQALVPPKKERVISFEGWRACVFRARDSNGRTVWPALTEPRPPPLLGFTLTPPPLALLLPLLPPLVLPPSSSSATSEVDVGRSSALRPRLDKP
jgi:hypothetical protein